MSERWDSFLAGFDKPEATSPDEPAIFEQLDAVRDERIERGDNHWWPAGPDPQALERLVRERKARR